MFCESLICEITLVILGVAIGAVIVRFLCDV